jgi:beta-glucanase (GH16 family)
MPSRSGRLAAALAALAVFTGLTTASAAAPPQRVVATTDRALSACGGARIAKPGGGFWRCTWADEFRGSRLDATKWSAVSTEKSGYRSGIDCYRDSTKNVFVARGALRLRVRKEASPFVCRSLHGDLYVTQYSAGMVSTAGKFARAYGRFEARVRFPGARVQGLQSAFWLWPEQPNRYGPFPASGEIDIAELFTAYPDRLIPYVHYLPYDDQKVTNNYCMVQDPSAWHVLTLVWTPQELRFKYDGRTCLRSQWRDGLLTKKPAPFDAPFSINLTQGLGVMGNSFQPGRTPMPATMRVDYVRVWR